MEFEEYLKMKKINSEAFKKGDFETWKTWEETFKQIHPESFTVQKKFLINKIRRKYMLKED